METARRTPRRSSRRNLHRRAAAVLATALLAVVCASIGTTIVAHDASAGTGSGGLGYTPIVPCRVVSTTSGTPFGDGETRVVHVGGSGPAFAAQGGNPGGCGVPDDAAAAVLSVTAVAPTGTGNLRAYSSGIGGSSSVTVHFSGGPSATNTAAIGLNAAGVSDLRIDNAGAITDVVVDVHGFYTASSPVNFSPVTPCRVVNTVAGSGTPFAPNESRQVQVAGTGVNFAAQGGNANGCGIPDGAAAVEVSITAIDATANGYLRGAKAGTSDADMKGTLLNYRSARNLTNTTTVDLAPSGALDLKLRNFGATTDLVVDVQGYYSTSAASRFVPITPCKVASTLTAGTPWPANGIRGLHVAGSSLGATSQGVPSASPACGVDPDARAVMANLSAVGPTADGYLRIWPAGTTPPNATMLNYAAGQSTSNAGAVGIATSGDLDVVVRNLSGATHFEMFVLGYFAPATDAEPLVGLGATSQTSCFVRDSADPQADMLCWGGNGEGQIGSATATIFDEPAPTELRVLDGSCCGERPWTGVVQAAGGRLHACGLEDDGHVRCWGWNSVGQIAVDPALTTAVILVRLPIGEPPDLAVQVAAGGNTSCMTLQTGKVKCWGEGSSGQLGTGTVDSFDPVTVANLDGIAQVTTNAPSIGSGGHSCATTIGTGVVSCWGSNNFGQLGVTASSSKSTPVLVPGLSGVVQVAAGDLHTCSLDWLGTVKCWGRGGDGQLGNGAGTTSSVPVTVALPEPAIRIGTGAAFSCALLQSGRVSCWGAGTNGRLGNGSYSKSLVPSAVSTAVTLGGRTTALPISGSTDLVVGTAHACTTNSAGTVRCWGINSKGQLGLGSASPASVARPVIVQGMPS